MLRVAVVDDEVAFIDIIRKQIQDYLDDELVIYEICFYTSPVSFLAEHELNNFDLIYLDIDMPKINGIELASKIREKSVDAHIVFVSSYSHFVFETFQYAPYRFIRKEKIASELIESIKSYYTEVHIKKQHLQFQLSTKESCSELIAQIAYFYSLRHDLFYVLHSGESKKLANRIYTMDRLEKSMQAHGFIRIHKSYLVNYKYIYQIHESKVLLMPYINDKIEQLPLSAKRVIETKALFQRLTRGNDTI